MTPAPQLHLPDRSPTITLADGRLFTPGSGGAGSPELAYIDPQSGGRRYIDPLPWCPLVGALGYERDGFTHPAEFVSVTTKLGNLPTHRLVAWNGLQAAKCAAQRHQQQLLERFGPEIMVPFWATAGERTRDMAGTRGTLVHDIAEDGEKVIHCAAEELLAGHDLNPWFVTEANCAPYVKALIKFFEAYRGIRPVWVEVTVFSRRYGIGGTLDLIAWVPGLGLVLIDWKSTNHMLAKMSFQLAAYRYAEYAIIDGQRVPIPEVDGGYVVHLMPGDPDPVTGEQHGAFEVHPMDGDPEQLAIYDAMTIVGRWDHPSRIGKPLPHPGTLGLASEAHGQQPNVTVVSIADAVMHRLHPETFTAEVLADGAPGLVAHHGDQSVPVEVPDPIVRLNRAHEAWLQADRAWFGDCATWLTERAVTSPEADFYAQELGQWWATSGVAPYGDALFGCDDTVKAQYEELCKRLQWYCDRLEMPFNPRPVEPDWDDLMARFEADAQALAEAAERHATPPTMQDLGHLLIAAQTGTLDPAHRIVTLARRSMSVAPGDEWGKPANPTLVEACKALADRVAKLPGDLIDRLDEWKREVGVPNLRTISMRPEQLSMITAKADEAFDEWRQRCTEAYGALNEVTGTADNDQRNDFLYAVLELAAPGVCSIEDCTGPQLELVHMLCGAVRRQEVALSVDDDGDMHLVPALTELDLTARFGPTKTKVRIKAREAAVRLGLPAPRSVAEAAESALLVAALGDQDAIQEQGSAPLHVGEPPEDGEGIPAGDAEGEEAPRAGDVETDEEFTRRVLE